MYSSLNILNFIIAQMVLTGLRGIDKLNIV